MAIVPTQTRDEATVGGLLRWWRTHRRLSQLELALKATVSTRHLSFVETGRAKPSRELVLHLAEHLDVPLRARNEMLVAGGYAPVFRETPFEAPDMGVIRDAVDVILRGHEPLPALAVDHAWNMVAANAGMAVFVGALPPELVTSPLNVIRASLHPDGMARFIVNFEEYASHLVWRLRRQHDATGDPDIAALLAESLTYPRVADAAEHAAPAVVLPMRLQDPTGADRILSFFSTMTVFGAPLDITIAELAIESFFPADEVTAAAVRDAQR